MKHHQAMFSQAIKFVRKIRPSVCPNLGFELQLKKYQERLGLGEVRRQPDVGKPSPGEADTKKKLSFVEPKQMMLTFSG